MGDKEGGFDYGNKGIGWNLEMGSDVSQYPNIRNGIITLSDGAENIPAQNIRTILRLSIRLPRASEDPADPNNPNSPNRILRACEHPDIQRWMVETDWQYYRILEQMRDRPGVAPIFILNNEPNHNAPENGQPASSDPTCPGGCVEGEVALTAREYGHLYNCYYKYRWTNPDAVLIEGDNTITLPDQRPLLFAAGPGHWGPGNWQSWETIVSDWFAPGIFDEVDGYAMHVYGYKQPDDTNPDNSELKRWLDLTMREINEMAAPLNTRPVIITEYNPGVNDRDKDAHPPAQGWEDWFNRTYCWAAGYQQLRGLLYFIDEEDQFRDQHVGNETTWWASSLDKFDGTQQGNDDPNEAEPNRRQLWLDTPNKTAPCSPRSYAPPQKPKSYVVLPASSGYNNRNLDDNQQIPGQDIHSQSLPTSGSIGGVISGTLGVRGYDNIFYVTDDLEVPAGQTFTVTGQIK